MFVLYSSSNFPTHFVNVWLILHFKILQNNFYINAFSINFLVNVNWGGGSAKCQRLSTRGEGGRKSRKSCQRSLRMPPYLFLKIWYKYVLIYPFYISGTYAFLFLFFIQTWKKYFNKEINIATDISDAQQLILLLSNICHIYLW